MEELVALLRRRGGMDRVTVPALRVLDHLFSSGASPRWRRPRPRSQRRSPRTSSATSRGAQGSGMSLNSVSASPSCAISSRWGRTRAATRSRPSRAERAWRGEGRAPRTTRGEAVRADAAMRAGAAGNRWRPRVRRVAAEQLYVTLLGMSDEDDPGLEAAADRLSETRWTRLSVVKPARNELYPMLRLVPPAALVEARDEGSRGRRKMRTSRPTRRSWEARGADAGGRREAPAERVPQREDILNCVSSTRIDIVLARVMPPRFVEIGMSPASPAPRQNCTLRRRGARVSRSWKRACAGTRPRCFRSRVWRMRTSDPRESREAAAEAITRDREPVHGQSHQDLASS